MWEPTQRIQHLGLMVDSTKGTFEVDEKKLQKTQAAAQALRCAAAGACRRVCKRSVAKFVGLAQFLLPAVPQARFFLRELHNCMGELKGWSGKVRLSRQAMEDLQWWRTFHRTAAHGGPIWKPVTTAVVSTDASDFGWGGAVHSPAYLEARGFWTAEERELHITAKELLAVVRFLETHGRALEHRHVRLLCDNQAVVAVINHCTSRSGELMKILRQLHRLAGKWNLDLQVEYIRSADNTVADRLSRETDQEDWRLNPHIFELIGGHRCTVDRFASATNAQLPRFNSRWPCPGAEGVDALAQSDEDWYRELNYCNPPWSVLELLARKLYSSGAAALVVSPAWTHTIAYQALASMASRTEILRRSVAMFRPGRPLRGVGAPKWDVAIHHIPRRAPRRPISCEYPFCSAMLAG